MTAVEHRAYADIYFARCLGILDRYEVGHFHRLSPTDKRRYDACMRRLEFHRAGLA